MPTLLLFASEIGYYPAGAVEGQGGVIFELDPQFGQRAGVFQR